MKKTIAIALIVACLPVVAYAGDEQGGALMRFWESIRKSPAPAQEQAVSPSDAPDAVVAASPAPDAALPAWIKHASSFTPKPGKALIAIVIDDVGLNRKHSAKALKLPPEITMSYLPYAPNIREQAAGAKALGHEILLHLPMQPLRRSANPGPDYLGTQFPMDEIRRRTLKNLDAFDGYIGVNNHMGSRFTRDRQGMAVVMEELDRRGLMFLDSKTVGSSVAEKTALEAGVPATHRDVFLDDEETEVFTEGALIKTEAYARKYGSAIAIGHPKAITLHDLVSWIATLDAKGFQLAPLSAVLRYRMENPGGKKQAVQDQPPEPVSPPSPPPPVQQAKAPDPVREDIQQDELPSIVIVEDKTGEGTEVKEESAQGTIPPQPDAVVIPEDLDLKEQFRALKAIY